MGSNSQLLTITLPGTKDYPGEKSVQEDILKEISKTLSTVIKAVNDIKESIHDWKDQTISKTITTVPDTVPDTSERQTGQTLEQISTHLEKINTAQPEKQLCKNLYQ